MKKVLIFLFAIACFTSFAQDRPDKTYGPLWINQGDNYNLIINKASGDTAQFKLSNQTLEFIVNNIKLSKITFPDNTILESAVSGGLDTNIIATQYWVETQIEGLVPIDTSYLRNDINNIISTLELKADTTDNATRSWVQMQISGLTPIDTTFLRRDINLKLNITDTAGFLRSFTEIDPYFIMWDKSTGISITESQIIDLKNYLLVEVDGDSTNELQDTTQIPGLKDFVESYSINEFTETDPIYSADSSKIVWFSDTVSVISTKGFVINLINDIPVIDTTNLSDSLRIVSTKVDSLINNSTDPVNDTLTAYNCDTLYVSDYIELNGTFSLTRKITLLDDGAILLPTATTGIVNCVLGDNAYVANFTYKTDGTFVSSYSYGDVFWTNSGDGLQIYDNGAYVVIRNTSGVTLDLLVTGIR
jgi:hypothetical protein